MYNPASTTGTPPNSTAPKASSWASPQNPLLGLSYGEGAGALTPKPSAGLTKAASESAAEAWANKVRSLAGKWVRTNGFAFRLERVQQGAWKPIGGKIPDNTRVLVAGGIPSDGAILVKWPQQNAQGGLTEEAVWLRVDGVDSPSDAAPPLVQSHDQAAMVLDAESDKARNVAGAKEKLLTVDTMGDGLYGAAGALLDLALPEKGDEITLDLEVRLKGVNLKAAKGNIKLLCTLSGERTESGQLRVKGKAGLAVYGEVDVWLVEAFAEASLFGYVEVAADSGAEVFQVMCLPMYQSLSAVNEDVAAMVWGEDFAENVIAGMGGAGDVGEADYVEGGFGLSIEAGLGSPSEAVKGEASAGYEYRNGTRLSSDDGQDLDFEDVSRHEVSLSATTPEGGWKFDVAASWQGRKKQGELEVRARRQYEVPPANELTVRSVAEMFAESALQVGDSVAAALEHQRDESGVTRQAASVARTVSGISLVDDLAQAKLVELKKLSRATIGQQISVDGTWNSDTATVSISLDRFNTMSMGDRNASPVFGELDLLSRVMGGGPVAVDLDGASTTPDATGETIGSPVSEAEHSPIPWNGGVPEAHTRAGFLYRTMPVCLANPEPVAIMDFAASNQWVARGGKASRPNDVINRAEALQAMSNIYGWAAKPEPQAYALYADVGHTDYWFTAAHEGRRRGIGFDTPANEFRAGALFSAAQAEKLATEGMRKGSSTSFLSPHEQRAQSAASTETKGAAATRVDFLRLLLGESSAPVSSVVQLAIAEHLTVRDVDDPAWTAPIPRAEAFTMLARKRGLPASGPLPEALPFVDVHPDFWYFRAVQFCRAYGLIRGTQSNELRPDDPLGPNMATVAAATKSPAPLSPLAQSAHLTSNQSAATPTRSSALRHRVVQAAQRHLGARYAWGADGPSLFDCSGFVLYVLRQEMGLIDWPDTTAAGIASRLPAPNGSPKRADLAFRSDSGSITHVEILTGTGAQTIGSSGGGPQTHGDNPNAKVQYGSASSLGRPVVYRSIEALLAGPTG